MNRQSLRKQRQAGRFIAALLASALLAGCADAPQAMPSTTSPPESPEAESQSATETPPGSPLPPTAVTAVGGSPTSQPVTTPNPEEATPYPEAWMNMPIVPAEISDTAREIYAYGQERGNDPHSFSIIGDCQAVIPFFLASFERPEEYSLGEEYAYLQEVIDYFAGSFYRDRYAVGPGCSGASMLSPLWADPEACLPNESPLDCEYRTHLPSIMIITMERKDYRMTLDSFEWYLRKILDFCVENGVVPIVATKADNLEGDYSINETLVRVAVEYDVPVWNFWAAVQPLPHQGLRTEYGDEFHLTFRHNFFDNPENMQYAWPVRNLTALQSLDAVWRGVTEYSR